MRWWFCQIKNILQIDIKKRRLLGDTNRRFLYLERKIVRQNQEIVCENKRIMLTKGRLCKRRRAEKVERTECTHFRKNGHNQSPFQNINVNL